MVKLAKYFALLVGLCVTLAAQAAQATTSIPAGTSASFNLTQGSAQTTASSFQGLILGPTGGAQGFYASGTSGSTANTELFSTQYTYSFGTSSTTQFNATTAASGPTNYGLYQSYVMTVAVPTNCAAGTYTVEIHITGGAPTSGAWYPLTASFVVTSNSTTTTGGTTGTTTGGSTSSSSTTSGTTGTSSSSSTGSNGCFGSTAGCGSGSSTFTGGYSPTTGGSISYGGVSISLPPLIGGSGFTSPGDLGIGIPGIGSISLPSNWFTLVIDMAMQSAGMTGPQMSMYTQLATDQSMQSNNLTGTYLKQAVNDDLTSNNLTGSYIDNAFKTELIYCNNTLWTPSSTDMTSFQATLASFIDWGPYHFLTSTAALFTSPPTATDGSIGGSSLAIGLPVPTIDTSGNSSINIGTDGSVTSSGGFVWTDSGQRIPIPTNIVTDSPGFSTLYAILTGAVWIGFVWLVIHTLTPKLEV